MRIHPRYHHRNVPIQTNIPALDSPADPVRTTDKTVTDQTDLKVDIPLTPTDTGLQIDHVDGVLTGKTTRTHTERERSVSQHRQDDPYCNRCKVRHRYGYHVSETRVCFKCGKQGHIAIFCKPF